MPASDAPRPEQTFFADPALDRLMGVTMALAAEVYVLRSRLLALEARVTDGTVAAGPASSAEPTADEDAAAFVRRLCEPLLGEQQARGPR